MFCDLKSYEAFLFRWDNQNATYVTQEEKEGKRDTLGKYRGKKGTNRRHSALGVQMEPGRDG